MQYKDFVKEQMAKMPKDMMAKEKMKAIGKLWRESGHSKSGEAKVMKPKNVKGGQIVGAGVKPKKEMKPKKAISMSDHRKMIEAIPLNIASQLLKGF